LPLDLFHTELFITETEQLQPIWDTKSSSYIKKKPKHETLRKDFLLTFLDTYWPDGVQWQCRS